MRHKFGGPEPDNYPMQERIARERALPRGPEPVTDRMIQAACVAGYGVDTDKDTNLYKLMTRAIRAALDARS